MYVPMTLSQILKKINDPEQDILILDRTELNTLKVYIKQLEKVIDTELK